MEMGHSTLVIGMSVSALFRSIFRKDTAMIAKVGVIMGSQSDWDTMKFCVSTLKTLDILYKTNIISAHRTPNRMFTYAEAAQKKGIEVIVAGAGGAAHLPGMVAAKTCLPVLGVPIQSKALQGQDSLLSIVQMPAGVPVATFAIGVAGAKNAALFAAAILALKDPAIAKTLKDFRKKQTQSVADIPKEL